MPPTTGMNVVLLVVDSLRARPPSLDPPPSPNGSPFGWLENGATHFRRAYGTECWTLPSHCSMFTGLLPSEHAAHFQTMGYGGPSKTIAELLQENGFCTELVTRNFVFDGTIPGITRGFQRNIRILSDTGRLDPFALFLAVAKPRFRRHLQRTGFFHPLHKENREFLRSFARSLLPADRPALTYVLETMQEHRRHRRPFFVFCNLYDVHAPYPPTPSSILRSFSTPAGCAENLGFPYVMSRLGAHSYLRPGFRLSERGRRMLVDRYNAAVRLMEEKLQDFWETARAAGILDDTLVILTSDHGEAFGEHDLYLHDASVYDTHLHVPLWIHHPNMPPETIDDVVSTKDLFGLIRAAAVDGDLRNTILHPSYRERHHVALAQHFHYPHLPGADPKYKQNIGAVLAGRHKIILRREGVLHYDLSRDPHEIMPERASVEDFANVCAREGIDGGEIRSAMDRLRAGVSAGGQRRDPSQLRRVLLPQASRPSSPARRCIGTV